MLPLVPIGNLFPYYTVKYAKLHIKIIFKWKRSQMYFLFWGHVAANGAEDSAKIVERIYLIEHQQILDANYCNQLRKQN